MSHLLRTMAVRKPSEKPTEMPLVPRSNAATAATSSQEPGQEMLSTALVYWAALVKMMLFWDGRSAALFGAAMKARAADTIELDWETEQASYSGSSEWTDPSDLPEPTTLPTALGPEAVVMNSSPDQSPQLLPQAPPRPTAVQGPRVGDAEAIGDAKANPVQGPRFGDAEANPVQGPRVGNAEAKPKAKAKAAPGTQGTFAGRRCPTGALRRANFDELKAHYMQARLDTMATKEPTEASGSKSSTKQKRKFSENQEKYWASMQKRMHELAQAGVPGGERMRIAASDWKAAMEL